MHYRVMNILSGGKRIADLGCGSGKILEELGNRYHERIGLDVSRQRLAGEKNNNDWDFYESDLNSKFPINDEFVDAVIANQVIEHIISPHKFMEEIYRILSPGGICVITTPNIRYIKNIISLVFSGYGPRTAGGNTLDGEWDDGHIHYFTNKDLTELATNVGFSKVYSCGHINDPQSNIVRRALDTMAKTKFVREFLSGCILLWAEK